MAAPVAEPAISPRQEEETRKALAQLKRADPNHPENFLACESALGAVDGDDCKAIAATLKGKTLNLPYQATNGDCSLALWTHKRGWTAKGDEVAARIEHDVDVCSSGAGGMVGRVVDSSIEWVALFPGVKIWFGQLCAEFGIGTANCVQGDSP